MSDQVYMAGTNGRPNLMTYEDYGTAGTERYWFQFHCAIEMRFASATEWAQFKKDLRTNLAAAKATIKAKGTWDQPTKPMYDKLIDALYQT